MGTAGFVLIFPVLARRDSGMDPIGFIILRFPVLVLRDSGTSPGGFALKFPELVPNVSHDVVTTVSLAPEGRCVRMLFGALRVIISGRDRSLPL